MDSSKFILGIKKHSVFGYVFVPLIVNDEQKEFYEILRTVVYQDIIDFPNDYSRLEKKIITIIDSYSDENIYKYFNNNKKISEPEFINSLNAEIVEKHIRPYIEKKTQKILDILRDNDIEIYHRPYRYGNIYKADLIKINSVEADVIFNFERNDDGLRYYLTVTYNDKVISIFNKKSVILTNKPAQIEIDGKILKFSKIEAKKLLPFFSKEYIVIPKKIEVKYFRNFILKTVRDYKVKATGFEIKSVEPARKVVLQGETNWQNRYTFIPVFFYDDKKFFINDDYESSVNFDEKTFRVLKFSRDKKWENKHLNFLKKCGLEKINDNSFALNIDTKDKDLAKSKTIEWLTENYKKISDFGFEIEQMFSQQNFFLKEINLDFEVKNNLDWFDIRAIVHFGEFQIPFYSLGEHILNENRQFLLPNGQIALIPESWFAKYKNLFRFATQATKDKIKLKKVYYFAIEQAQMEKSDSAFEQLDEFFKNPHKQKTLVPHSLRTSLRDYQEIGFSWLTKLQENNFGGCLADDMGLGKTVQVLATILKSLENNNQINLENTIFDPPVENRLLNLIIVPRSLLHNWLNEVKKNTPLIKAFVYAGYERKNFLYRLKQVDLVITSYGIARNDVDILCNYDFNYVVLDESQYIKNPNSKTFQALKLLKAKNKIVLTGTPIENSLSDLWSQLTFANNDFLGSFSFFKSNYIVPIEKNNDENTKNDLKKLIAPFILRRTKEEVVKDLPEIEEQTLICEMTEEQNRVYTEEKSRIRNKIIEFYRQGTLKKSSVYVLQALTKLRQIANHPVLIDSEYQFGAGKFDEIMSRLETLMENNHKVLIFSSFVKYLSLLEREFEKRQYKYAILTGKSTNRSEIIEKFQTADDVKLFLISLKAGGVGINLTAADYVFILDPWWNPAIERQAIARAHRIGQNKNVFAFRFITFGTVEEKIQKLQKQKLELAQEFIDANNYFKYFSEDAIIELFE